jgi:hypothetical protein
VRPAALPDPTAACAKDSEGAGGVPCASDKNDERY